MGEPSRSGCRCRPRFAGATAPRPRPARPRPSRWPPSARNATGRKADSIVARTLRGLRTPLRWRCRSEAALRPARSSASFLDTVHLFRTIRMFSHTRAEETFMSPLTLVRDEERDVLTARQRENLEIITRSITTRGYPRTLREIGTHFGIRSTNGVNAHLRALEKKGYLQREDLKSRALRPVTSTGKP